MTGIVVVKIIASILMGGWLLLSTTSASILLPHWEAALDRLFFSLSLFREPTPMKLGTLLNLVSCYGFLLPLSAYLWALDEVLDSSYKTTQVQKPVFMFSVTRAGTTSFQRTLALDERLVTPVMLDFVLPFLCVQKGVYAIHNRFPQVILKLENFLKRINGVTPEVDLRHPVGLLKGESDDILFGVWHWVSGDACRTFPVRKFFWKYYEMGTFRKEDRLRTLRFHQKVCQKVLYRANVLDKINGAPPKRLLLRSHFTQCIDDVQGQYPDATLIGIFRDPVDVVRSFAGLLVELKVAGMDEISLKNQQQAVKEEKTWAELYADLLADLMSREGQLHEPSTSQKQIWMNTGYVAFPKYKADPVKALEELYDATGMGTTEQFREAIKASLAGHQGYKIRHEYKNPTFEDLGLDKDEFMRRPGVQRYTKLLEAKC